MRKKKIYLISPQCGDCHYSGKNYKCLHNPDFCDGKKISLFEYCAGQWSKKEGYPIPTPEQLSEIKAREK
uniref:Uncharacterized protein n=1 Tax=viral metagenome TaxID=1070528 RepID=A0A6M3J5F4_9ZZZZ